MNMKQSMASTRLIIGLCCTLSVAVHAKPNINNVEKDEDTLIINGEEFGSNSLDVAVIDTIDSRMVNEDGNSSSLAYEGFWGQEGNPWASPLTPEAKEGPLGDSSNKIYSARSKSFNGWPSIMDDKTNRSLYVSWWFKPSKSPSDQGGSNKFIRIWDDKDGEHTRLSWTQMHLVHGPNGEQVSWNGWGGEVGQWNLMEIYVDSDGGTIQTWVNRKLTHDIDDFEKADTDKGLTIGLIGFDASYPDRYPDIDINIDDIYFSSSRARVVASKKDAWSEAKKEQFAMLPLSWDSNKIQVQLSDKISRNINQYFFYVVDDLGNSNEQGVSLCSECPETVDSLRVE